MHEVEGRIIAALPAGTSECVDGALQGLAASLARTADGHGRTEWSEASLMLDPLDSEVG
jgi:hypothetical protein